MATALKADDDFLEALNSAAVFGREYEYGFCCGSIAVVQDNSFTAFTAFVGECTGRNEHFVSTGFSDGVIGSDNGSRVAHLADGDRGCCHFCAAIACHDLCLHAFRYGNCIRIGESDRTEVFDVALVGGQNFSGDELNLFVVNSLDDALNTVCRYLVGECERHVGAGLHRSRHGDGERCAVSTFVCEVALFFGVSNVLVSALGRLPRHIHTRKFNSLRGAEP